MFRPFLVAAALLAMPAAVSIPTPGASAGATQPQTGERCQQRNQERRRGGAIAGALGRSILHRVVPGGSAIVSPMGSMLGDAIMNLLDCDEQQKAAAATEEATRGGVGTTSTWESTSRRGVTGSSTVTAADTNSAEGDCMTVTDIVIIDGQETRAPKRMCRRPPNNRYVRV